MLMVWKSLIPWIYTKAIIYSGKINSSCRIAGKTAGHILNDIHNPKSYRERSLRSEILRSFLELQLSVDPH